MLRLRRRAEGHLVTLIEIRVHLMDLTCAAVILATDNRFRTRNLELKCLGTSFGAQKQQFSIPRDSTCRHVIKAYYLHFWIYLPMVE